MDDLLLPRNHSKYVPVHARCHHAARAYGWTDDSPAPPRSIHFGQIMGMCDHVTAALGLAGYNAHKLVLFGEFRDLFPWLLRRLDENGDVMGAMATERSIIGTEVQRREKARVAKQSR
jgi:hypothetical protein